MVNIRQLQGASACHMCGRCAGYRGAVMLQPRPFHEEVVIFGAQKNNIWEMRPLLYGMIGVVIGAFGWSSSYWLVFFKPKLVTWLIGQGMIWPLEKTAFWWILTHYPPIADSFNWLDGFCISLYILGYGALFGLFLKLDTIAYPFFAAQGNGFKQHLAQTYLPLAAAGFFKPLRNHCQIIAS